MKYIPVVGSVLSKADAIRYGQRISHLEKRMGHVTPKMLVEDGKSRSSPLHAYFEWNDSVAAYSYRIEQAQYLLRSIAVDVEDVSQPTARAFFNVSDTDAEGKKVSIYVSQDAAFSKPEYTKQIIQQALSDAKNWYQRYRTYKELSKITDAIYHELSKRGMVEKRR